MSAALDELRHRYLRAQLTGDRREAVRLVVEDGLALGRDVLELQTAVIQAAQREIGALWQRNEVTIAQEHMATAISQLALAALFERAILHPRIDRAILIACVDGELHDLPARIVADILDLSGFDVKFVGASVPHDHLVELVRKERPDGVGLSVTMSFNLPSARVAIGRLRAAGIEQILIGGHATTWSRGALGGLGVMIADAEPESFVAAARALTGAS
jgi:methanogenic corrinoid protein MtbC1